MAHGLRQILKHDLLGSQFFYLCNWLVPLHHVALLMASLSFNQAQKSGGIVFFSLGCAFPTTRCICKIGPCHIEALQEVVTQVQTHYVRSD